MCDTLARHADGITWFAKNSDREPGEPQVVERHVSAPSGSDGRYRCTYIGVEASAPKHAVIISRPQWCWGAEIGVNAAGVAIGNEAIFSRRKTLKPALLGMDLLRLALERAENAESARVLICDFLERYGQGGPAGYLDRGFCYDNSFLIADATQVIVLETAGRDWAWRRVAEGAISNGLTIGTDRDGASAGVRSSDHFAQRFDTRVMPFFAASRTRQQSSQACVAQLADFAGLAAHLRSHKGGHENPATGSNRDICMHAAGPIRRSQTTGSLIARLSPEGPRIAVTGTSAPCLSVFRPVDFVGEWSVLHSPDSENESLWRRHEALHRVALGSASLRQHIRQSRMSVEKAVFQALETGNQAAMSAADQRAEMLTHAWYGDQTVTAALPHQIPPFWRRLDKKLAGFFPPLAVD